jgi:hypothetical protein
MIAARAASSTFLVVCHMMFLYGRHTTAMLIVLWWFPISGIKREHGAARRANAVAAPATVSGEPSAIRATGQPGRRREVRTREPGDLPSPWSIAGASAGVSRCEGGRVSSQASHQVLFFRSRWPLCARGEDAAQRSQGLGRPCRQPDHLSRTRTRRTSSKHGCHCRERLR